MIYFCCDELRRNAVRGTTLNGIDYLEVFHPVMPQGASQQTVLLYIHLVNPIFSQDLLLAPENIRIEGGERIHDIRAKSVTRGKQPGQGREPRGTGRELDILTVEVEPDGDFSTYTLRLVKDAEGSQPPDNFDPALSAVDFSFKVECPSDFDCRPERICAPEPMSEPEIDYLAKDYSSFRQLMLDRMALLLRQQERNPADLGVALVELLAYMGDYLSYQQDAIATEAYLGTARRRISVRRHARLVDYAMHDGCNARTWMQVKVSADTGPLPQGTKLLTRLSDQPVCVAEDFTLFERAEAVFETMYEVDKLYADHNQFNFYTWSDRRCCLPKGATSATLEGHHPNLKAGDVLILEEVLNPGTGQAADADPKRRHAVRLTQVVPFAQDEVPLIDPVTETKITEILWSSADALPFPFCISDTVENVSVALGNIVLADHGRTVTELVTPKTVPEPKLFYPRSSGNDRCESQNPKPIPIRYRPRLPQTPLTHAAPYDASKSAANAMCWELKDAQPAVYMNPRQDANEKTDKDTWKAVPDLLLSHAGDIHFVVETEDDGAAYIRFGDGRLGKRPESGTSFMATYRVGNGVAGNIGAGSLVHIATPLRGIDSVSNPLSARGGIEPESLEDVRQRAPSAFHTQERAVTPEDYAEVTQRVPGIQRAAATFRWTGSWHTVFVTIDPYGEIPEDEKKAELHSGLVNQLEHYRMAGHDVEIDWPRYANLEIELQVCVKPDYFRSDVKKALLEAFSNRVLPDGRRGAFHPDHFTFGQTLYLSRFLAEAQAVSGVAHVAVTKFQRRGHSDWKVLQAGKLELDRLETARCDNDPSFPERGTFRLIMGGGK